MNYDILIQTPLFAGIHAPADEVLSSLSYTTKRYDSGEIIYRTGEIVQNIGLVLQGSVQIENVDIYGNTSILGLAECGDVFAEAYACAPNQPMLVDVITREPCEILFLNVPELLRKQDTSPYASLILANLLRVFSRKNVALSMRIFHSSPKKIRDRLISYFSEQVTRNGSTHLTIPLDRQQLADYLGVDRTALSKELGRMRDEGMIDFRKNHFDIYIEE